MEFMKEAVSLSGIINGLIVAVLFEVLRNNVKFFPSLTVVDSPKSRPVERISRTQRNREILFNIGFYFFTYMLIYFAILLPASIKANFSDTVVFLSHAKTIGFLLPDIEVTQANIQLKLALLAIVVYIPLFFIINIK
ncbi:hypothetical protein MED121_04303 [Marinomonas sp. MED121]|nr:hypothetical protein MED121_04303 [Marinomonas sp. MED121]